MSANNTPSREWMWYPHDSFTDLYYDDTLDHFLLRARITPANLNKMRRLLDCLDGIFALRRPEPPKPAASEAADWIVSVDAIPGATFLNIFPAPARSKQEGLAEALPDQASEGHTHHARPPKATASPAAQDHHAVRPAGHRVQERDDSEHHADRHRAERPAAEEETAQELDEGEAR